MKKEKMIVDCPLYFKQRELLELRMHLLGGVVDQVVFFEGNRSYSGIPNELECKKVIDELDLPFKEKIRVVEVDMPTNDKITLDHYDHVLTERSCSWDRNTWHRERFLRDSVLSIVDDYPDDTVFILCDGDEYIKPELVTWFADMARRFPDIVLRVPLVQLEGRADMRVYEKETDTPRMFDKNMVLCMKHHFRETKPSILKENLKPDEFPDRTGPAPAGTPINRFDTNYVHQDGIRVEDCGWHFSWMGGGEAKINKLAAYSHYSDIIHFFKVPEMQSNAMKEFLMNQKIEEGSINVWGDPRTVMKKYPIQDLPQVIFELPKVRKFLFGV